MNKRGGVANPVSARLYPLSRLVTLLALLIFQVGKAANGPADLVTTSRNDTLSGFGDSSAPSVTPDGRFVVFVSAAGNLLTNDYNGTTDVFLHDRSLGRTMLVSVSTAGTSSANSASGSPSVSSNGRMEGSSYLKAWPTIWSETTTTD